MNPKEKYKEENRNELPCINCICFPMCRLKYILKTDKLTNFHSVKIPRSSRMVENIREDCDLIDQYLNTDVIYSSLNRVVFIYSYFINGKI